MLLDVRSYLQFILHYISMFLCLFRLLLLIGEFLLGGGDIGTSRR